MKKRLPRRPRSHRERRAETTVSMALAGMVGALLERIQVLSEIWGPRRAYVAVITTMGLVFLHFAQDNIRLAVIAAFIVIALWLNHDRPGEPPVAT